MPLFPLLPLIDFRHPETLGWEAARKGIVLKKLIRVPGDFPGCPSQTHIYTCTQKSQGLPLRLSCKDLSHSGKPPCGNKNGPIRPD